MRALLLLSRGLTSVALLAGCSAGGAPREGSEAAAPPPCVACTDAGSASRPEQIRFTLQASCANGGVELACHAVAAGGLTLGTADDFAQVIGVPSTERPELVRVAPGRPAESYLFLKVLGDGGIEGGPMPGGATDPALVALFGRWIEAGAPEK